MHSVYLAAVLSSPEIETDGGFVMEYVPGETLKQRIRRLGQLPVTEALAYAIEIARALQAAHDRGIVHRDVKPQNVLIDEEGRARVTDFGIARTLDEDGLTADGRVLGTTDYVSPEQALGRRVGPQSDLYSLGIVLYEMLVGDVPFKADNQVAVAMRHVREEIPDVQLQRPGVSIALAQLLDRLTAKDPARRPASAAAAIADLEDVLAIESSRSGIAPGEATEVLRTLPAATRNRVPWRMRMGRPSAGVLALLALLAVLGSIAAVVLLSQSTEPGTGQNRAVIHLASTPVREKEDPLAQSAASAFDPLGGDGEHDNEAINVLDGNPATTWSTQTYMADSLQKAGVGIYVDAKPQVKATRMEIQSETPGWNGAVYAAAAGPAPTQAPPANGWVQLATITQAKAVQSVPFSTETQNTPYRYFLVWITQLPPGGDHVAIRELVLFRRAGG